MSSLNNNLSECITLGDSSLACQTRVSFGRSGLARSRVHPRWSNLRQPAPAGSPGRTQGARTTKSTQHTLGEIRRAALSIILSVCLRKVSKNPVSPGCPRQPLSLTPTHRLIKEQTNVTQYYFPPRGDQFSNTRVWQ